jgi:hypothetical protein
LKRYGSRRVMAGMNPSLNCLFHSRFISARAVRLAGFGIALGALAGCATDGAGTGGTPAAASPMASRSEAVVVTPQQPPASRKEPILDQPSPLHVWVTGYWVWQEGKFNWVAGHWELPPRGTDTWVAPRWEKRGDSYAFTPGFWR